MSWWVLGLKNVCTLQRSGLQPFPPSPHGCPEKTKEPGLPAGELRRKQRVSPRTGLGLCGQRRCGEMAADSLIRDQGDGEKLGRYSSLQKGRAPHHQLRRGPSWASIACAGAVATRSYKNLLQQPHGKLMIRVSESQQHSGLQCRPCRTETPPLPVPGLAGRGCWETLFTETQPLWH